MPADRGDGVQAVRIRKPSDAANRNAGQAPAHIVFAAQLHLFRDEQPQERPAGIAEAHDREVIRRNSSVSVFRGTSSLPVFYFPAAAESFAAAAEIKADSSSSTFATRAADSSASFHFFCSRFSRTAGIAFAA